MQMIQRARAILVKEFNSLLLIKRVRVGMEAYWVLPGGGVEDADESPEAALHREVKEEMGASIHIHKLVFVLERNSEDSVLTRELFFLSDVVDYDFESRSGPEFSDPTRGEYIFEEISLDEATLRNTNIKPFELKEFLVRNYKSLFSLPDLRCQTGVQ